MGEKGLQLMIAMFEERRISQAIVEMKRLVDDCHRIRWQERERERGNNTR
jgi:type IV secretory pathway TrbF-like protein